MSVMSRVVEKSYLTAKYGAACTKFCYFCPCCNIEFGWDRQGKENKFCFNCGEELDWNLDRRLDNEENIAGRQSPD